MRICFLTQYYPPEIGAPQTRIFELARLFIAQGHTVWVMTAMPNYPEGKVHASYRKKFVKYEYVDGIHVLRSWIWPSQKVSIVSRLISYFSFVVSALVWGGYSLPKLDYLVTESPPLFLGLTGYVLSRLKRARWVFNVSDLWPASAVNLGVIGAGPMLTLAERLEAFFYRTSWLVTGQSREILQDIQQRFPAVKTYRLSNGVDCERFNYTLRSPTRRATLGAHDSSTCIAIYAGLHGIAQGLDQVLLAADQLRDIDTLHFVFIGDGPCKHDLQILRDRLKLERVTFMPPHQRDEIPGMLASGDIALVPLKQYIPGAVPSKIYEAMASSLPVMLIAEGEPAAIIEDAQAGLIAVPGAIDQLAQKLRSLALDPALRQQMGARGRTFVTAHFNRQIIGASFIKMLEEAVQ